MWGARVDEAVTKPRIGGGRDRLGITAEQFVEKWSQAALSERAASHEHFIDLCKLLGVPTPAQADKTGENYCFEKAVKVVGAASKGSKGDSGFVDVWKRGFFASVSKIAKIAMDKQTGAANGQN